MEEIGMQEDCLHLKKVALTFADYECDASVDLKIFCNKECFFYKPKEGEK
jgi:hypothetical protein